MRLNNEYTNKIHLKPGEMIVANSPSVITTVLGSCVSIILYSKINKISSISHAQLPEPNPKTDPCSLKCPRNCKENSETNTTIDKYVSCTIRFMIEVLNKKVVNADELIAAVYGGASLFDPINKEYNVGLRNVEMAKQILKKYKIKIINQDLLGKQSREINCYSDTGITHLESWIKNPKSSRSNMLYDSMKHNKTIFKM